MATTVPTAAIQPLHSQNRSRFSLSSSVSRISSSHQYSRNHLTSDFGVEIPNRNSISSSRTRISPVVHAKKQTFSSLDEMLSGTDKPVLVDFYATWCGPCQFMVPILDKVSAALKDMIQVVKIDTEKYPALADKYKIEALPTFIVFKDGEPCDRFEGALTADQMIQRIENSLKVKQ